MKIVVFHKDKKVHDWFLNADDPNDIAFMVTNCGSLFVRYGIAEIRRMENELEEFKANDAAELMKNANSAELEFYKSEADNLWKDLVDVTDSVALLWDKLPERYRPSSTWEMRS